MALHILWLACKSQLVFQFLNLPAKGSFKRDVFLLCYSLAVLYYIFDQFPVGREGDVLLLDCCVNPHFFYFLTYKIPLKEIYTCPEDLPHAFRADPVPEVYKVAWIKRELVLKVNFSAKVLPVGILQVPLNYSLISQVVHLSQKQKTDYCPDRYRRPANLPIQWRKLFFQAFLVNLLCQKTKFMLRMYKTCKHCLEHLQLWLYGQFL